MHKGYKCLTKLEIELTQLEKIAVKPVNQGTILYVIISMAYLEGFFWCGTRFSIFVVRNQINGKKSSRGQGRHLGQAAVAFVQP